MGAYLTSRQSIMVINIQFFSRVFIFFKISSTRSKRTDVLFKPINHICQIAFILNSVKIQKHEVLSELHRIMVLQQCKQ